MDIETEVVQKFYVAYFSRPADALGLDFWTKTVAAMNGDVSVLSAAFASSQEYRDTYAGKSSTAIIDTIYHNLFGRAAEPAALQFWGQALDNRAMTIDNAVVQISGAAQGDDAVIFQNKVIAAQAFSTALDTTVKVAGYSGVRANEAAKTWLAEVTTGATLGAATESAALDRAVSTVMQAAPVPGQTETLTLGADTIVGTAGDDVFMASVDKVPDSAWDTLGVNDAIDGGSGLDTLLIAAFTRLDSALLAKTRNIEIVELYGSGDVELDTAGLVGIKIIDGSASTGILTMSTGSDLSLRGGAGADVLAARGANATLNGGAGNDTLKVVGGAASAVTLTGGAGDDLFDVSSFTAANAAAAVTITDLAKGDRISFASSVNASFVSAKLALAPNASFDNYLAAAGMATYMASVNSGISWFQYQDNTFVVQDINGNGAFDGGIDILVKLTGLVDLTHASFSNGSTAMLVIS